WIRNEEEAVNWALENGIEEIPLVLINNNKIEGSNEEVAKKIVRYLLDNNLITRKELEENMRKVILFNARYLSEKLGEEIIVNEKMIVALVNKIIRHGLPYCPCRLKLSRENICPCESSIKELKSQGYCKCRLFLVKK
ncbi:MAG: ferredoxin-thioredoxin reductase catalytic domain-containing protein, partial [Candidatus Njordarchaeales archaeon]